MKSPLKKSIGEVVTDYGAKVMKVFKEGLLGRSLFDFYGDVKALTFRTKEVTTVPTTPPDGKGGVIYTKTADGKLYYKSNEISEVELSSQGSNTTYSVSCVDGDNSDEEKIRLTGSDSSTDDVVLEAGTGLSIARDSDKITFTNTVTDTNTQNTTTLSFVDSSNDVILRNTTGGAGSGTDDIKFVAGSNVTLTHTDADNITISSTDTNTVYSEATGSAEGLMSIAHHDKLDGIESSADVTDTTNVTAAGALMDSELTDLAGVKGVTISTLQVKPSEGAFANGDKTKLDGIEAGATADQTNVSGTAATVTAAAQPNITSLGTLTALDVDDINLNAKRITIVGDTDDTFTITSTTHGATTIETTDTAGAQANLNLVADGAITATSTSFTATTDDFTIASSTSNHPTLMIAHTGNNSLGGELVLHNKRGAAGVDGDICGLIHFKAPNHDGSDNFIFYASIIGSIVESNDTDEAGKLELYVTTSDGSSSTPQTGLVLTGSGSNNDVDVTIGHGATSVTTISGRARSTSTGDFSIPFRIFSVTGSTDGSFDGDVVRFGGTTSMTTGAIYFYNSSGNWELTDADGVGKSSGLLGVALGSASDTDGVLLRGMVTLSHDPGAVGDVLYLSTTGGQCSSTAPSGSGDIIRIVGYCLDASNGQIWFNPDSTFVEYTT